MTGLSLSQAAKATGRSKSTIGRAINSGRLSALRKDDDTFSIDPSELFRAFPKGSPGTGGDTSNETIRNPQVGTGGAGVEIDKVKALHDELSKAQQRVAAAEAKAEERAETIADLRVRLNQEGEERRRLTAILTDQKAPTPNQDRPFWRRFFS